MTIALWCLLVAVILPYVWLPVAFGERQKQFGSVDNKQPRGQVAVELDHGQRAAAFEQGLRHGAQAGADLDQRLPRPGRDGAHDLVDHHRIDQEMLAEALAGDMAHTGGSRISM